jgi:hypothetical protein
VSETKSATEFVLDEAAARDMHLVDRLTVNSNLVVEFYEPTPGAMIISEYGRAGHDTVKKLLPDVNLADLRPSDYYALLAPDRAVPTVLREAEARLGAEVATLPQQRVARPVPATPSLDIPVHDDIVEKSGGLCPATWFQSSFCGGGSDDFSWCDLNRHANSTRSKGNVAFFSAVVCVDTGQVTWTGSAAGLGGSWSVLEGFYRTWGVTCGSSFFDFCDEFTATMKVTDVSSDETFQHAGHVTLDD